MLKQSGRVHPTSFRSRTRVLDLVKKLRLHPSCYMTAVSDFYVSLNTPVSLSCWILFQNGEFDQLVEKNVDPSDYIDGSSFRDDFAAVSFLRKSEVLKTSFDRKANALKVFSEGETRCAGINRFFSSLQSSCGKIHPDDWFVINSQIRKIDRILGEFDIDTMLTDCRWGPGSTLSLSREGVSASHKFDFECDITPDAYRLFGEVMKRAFPLWGNLWTPNFKEGNKVVTVPKNAKTDRTIAIEPGLNVWIQLGIGKSIRRKLRFAGYNLDSDLKNQRGAYIGSLDNSLATIDFKAASDSISKGLVEFLLPPRWYTILNAARSHKYTLDGETKISEKFSTMGNGFTFELESLIFVTLALAICEANGCDDDSVSIFGDDLIIPTVCVPQLRRICELYGFTINTDKSYSYSAFRESCGSYYFHGMDVKPIFFKKGLQTVKDVYRLCNRLRAFSHSIFPYGCDRRFKGNWHRLIDMIPKDVRLFGPISSGDATIHADLSECSPKRHPGGWEGFIFPGFPSVAINCERETIGLLLSRLHTRSIDTDHRNSVPLRAKTRIVYKKAMFVSQWYSYGDWITIP